MKQAIHEASRNIGAADLLAVVVWSGSGAAGAFPRRYPCSLVIFSSVLRACDSFFFFFTVCTTTIKTTQSCHILHIVFVYITQHSPVLYRYIDMNSVPFALLCCLLCLSSLCVFRCSGHVDCVRYPSHNNAQQYPALQPWGALSISWRHGAVRTGKHGKRVGEDRTGVCETRFWFHVFFFFSPTSSPTPGSAEVNERFVLNFLVSHVSSIVAQTLFSSYKRAGFVPLSTWRRTNAVTVATPFEFLVCILAISKAVCWACMSGCWRMAVSSLSS